MPLVLAMDTAELRGVMDLVFQGADGQWEVLDYKTSAPGGRQWQPAAAEYQWQLGLYAVAASRWLGRPVRRWTVYFLGAGQPVERTVGPDDLARVEGVAREALAGIAGRQFGRTASGTCSHCRFLRLCEGG
jgi:RecB family exonuclease